MKEKNTSSIVLSSLFVSLYWSQNGSWCFWCILSTLKALQRCDVFMSALCKCTTLKVGAHQTLITRSSSWMIQAAETPQLCVFCNRLGLWKRLGFVSECSWGGRDPGPGKSINKCLWGQTWAGVNAQGPPYRWIQWPPCLEKKSPAVERKIHTRELKSVF